MRISSLLLFAIVLILSCTSKPPQSEFPILAWYGPEIHFADEDGYRTLHNAGFSHSFSTFNKKEQNLKALDAAQSNNVKLIVADERISKVDIKIDTTIFLIDSVIADYGNHPALYGYYLQDEPGKDDFSRLGKISHYFAEKDTVHSTYINLFPTYATPAQLDTSDYEGYIRAFIDSTTPTFLSYDHYPIRESGLRSDYYKNFEIIRKTALEYDIPFWAFSLSVHHSPYAKPIRSHLQMQVYSALAYGAKGIQYFTYAKPKSRIWRFREALVDESGAPTPIYPLVQKINSEIHHLSSTLLDLNSTGVYHSDPVPVDCSALIPGLPITKIEAENVLAGFFTGPGNTKYVLLLNKNYNSGVLGKFYFKEKIKQISEVQKDSKKPYEFTWFDISAEKSCQIMLKAGEGKLFRIYD
jgi:hypothetical protein